MIQYDDGGIKTPLSDYVLKCSWKRRFFYMFKESPILGAGKHSSFEEKREFAAEGLVAREALAFGHAHNEYLDALATEALSAWPFCCSFI
ncbi:hypothetical protein P4S72_07025 [Vibrio sp. PP-XX7]